MKISCILSYLVTPRKHNPAAEEIKGTRLPLKGRLCDMLSRIYEKSDTEYHIPIRFLMARDGSQENNIRTQILALAQEPHLASGRQLAAQLQEVTTEKSGLGLLFFIFGQNGSSLKFLISRFPAN